MERTNEPRFPRTRLPNATRTEIRETVSAMITFLELGEIPHEVKEEIITWTVYGIVHKNMERDSRKWKSRTDQDLLNVMGVASEMNISVFELLKKN